jgi:hypothetical protein
MKTKKKAITASEMGKRGAKARNKALSRAERVKLAKRAIQARWAKKR